jgi:glycosyltransferase involved in cell wall biosynthesis
MNKLSQDFVVTVGIPVYNEGGNIKKLLKSILSQNSIIIKKIIIYSDGSTDNTVREIKSLKKKNIWLIDGTKNKGVAFGLNKILGSVRGGVLLILNGDILIKDKDFISKLVRPIADGKADLTSAKIINLSAKTFNEKILSFSMQLKEEIFVKINASDNVFTCHGPARAFSEKVYKKIIFDKNIGDDAYSYFWVKSNNLIYKYVSGAVLYYRLPSTFKEHRQQSQRYYVSGRIYENKFGRNFIRQQYKIPINIYFPVLLKNLIRNPVNMISYLFMFFLSKTGGNFGNGNDSWIPVKSTKFLNQYE